MRLLQTEMDRLMVFLAAELARRRRATGLALNYPESLALICDEVHEAARRGASYDEAVAIGRAVLKEGEVLDGVASMMETVRLECLFSDGMRLVVLERPIGPMLESGRREDQQPGRHSLLEQPVQINENRRTVDVEVSNMSDHTVFIGSHYPFFEVNRRLVFDREMAWGMRLDIPAGDAVRWLPGEKKVVRLVEFGGRRTLVGFNRLTDGAASPERLTEGLRRSRDQGYGDLRS